MGKGRAATFFFPENGGVEVVDERVLTDRNSAVVTYSNPLDNVTDLAHHFFRRCLDGNITPCVRALPPQPVCRPLVARALGTSGAKLVVTPVGSRTLSLGAVDASPFVAAVCCSIGGLARAYCRLQDAHIPEDERGLVGFCSM